jgi:hypothetical protein
VIAGVFLQDTVTWEVKKKKERKRKISIEKKLMINFTCFL